MRAALKYAVLLMAAMPISCRPPATTGPRPRVISFSPTLTKLMFDLGLGRHVVGVTTYCALPPGQSRPVVGNRFEVRAEPILAARPDVILAQQDPQDFQALRDINPSIRIEHFQIESLAEVAAAAERVARIVGEPEVGRRAADDFRARLESLRRRTRPLPKKRVLFVIGLDRPLVAGPGTFLAEMIDAAGGVNAGADVKGSGLWRNTGAEGILAARPDVLIVQAEPGREPAAREFYQKLADLPAARAGQVHVLSDQLWTIPGLHLADLAQRLAAMIHPDLPTQPATAPATSTAPAATRVAWSSAPFAVTILRPRDEDSLKRAQPLECGGLTPLWMGPRSSHSGVKPPHSKMADHLAPDSEGLAAASTDTPNDNDGVSVAPRFGGRA